MVLRTNAGRLLVHQIAAQVTRDAGELTRSLRGPAAQPRGDQLIRAAGAVVASIDKACGRGSVAEFRQHIIYASGSAHELRSQLLIARLLDPKQAARCLELESRVTLMIKILGRLHDHPPP